MLDEAPQVAVDHDQLARYDAYLIGVHLMYKLGEAIQAHLGGGRKVTSTQVSQAPRDPPASAPCWVTSFVSPNGCALTTSTRDEQS